MWPKVVFRIFCLFFSVLLRCQFLYVQQSTFALNLSSEIEEIFTVGSQTSACALCANMLYLWRSMDNNRSTKRRIRKLKNVNQERVCDDGNFHSTDLQPRSYLCNVK